MEGWLSTRGDAGGRKGMVSGPYWGEAGDAAEAENPATPRTALTKKDLTPDGASARAEKRQVKGTLLLLTLLRTVTLPRSRIRSLIRLR